MKFFNTAGPCDERFHYMLPPEDRLPEARQLIERGQYFVVHAPRQTGKTTTLLALARGLTASGGFAALHISCEDADAGDDIEAVQRGILYALADAARMELPAGCLPPDAWPQAPPTKLVRAGLQAWAQSSPRRLVLFLDEIDALRGESLKTVLRQLRAGYPGRPESFPWSVVLCGLRDVRDYKAASGGDPERLGTSSPFNIKVASLRLGDFGEKDVRTLYTQHTEDDGRPFAADAVSRAYDLSQGQPWLVNALAAEIVDRLDLPPGAPVLAEHVDQAAERLIQARATHLDSLVARLHEPRVHRIIEPLIAGKVESEPNGVYEDDVQYVRDLGLLHRSPPLQIANPIYREVIVRVLAAGVEERVTAVSRDYVLPDGSLDMKALLSGFAAFWREHGDVLIHGLPYHEVAAQLVLMAYLHRIVKASGYIEREYGVGRGRIDLLIRWPVTGTEGRRREQREALELKVWAPGRPDPLEKGLEQLDSYLARLTLDHGVLVLFDRRPDAPSIPDRTRFDAARTPSGRPITVLRA